MTAIYNEIEPFAAKWLEELAREGHIAAGPVDRRSISDLRAADVAGPGQRHFFAGIGGWSYALRLAGVADDADVWTGSCPCQPFSTAGKGGGILDARHLWPTWFALIEQCRPPVIFGEQVASPDGLAWLDAVFADLERCGYSVGAADLCAAGVKAPHNRSRLYFVAHANAGSVGQRLHVLEGRSRQEVPNAQRSSEVDGLADSVRPGQTKRRTGAGSRSVAGRGGDDPSFWLNGRRHYADGSTIGGSARDVANAESERRSKRRTGISSDGRSLESGGLGATGNVGNTDDQPGRRNSGAVSREKTSGPAMRRSADGSRPSGEDVDPWAGEWIYCLDDKWRLAPTEPALFPLASGVPNRVGLLRGSGNAIVPQVAATFIRAALDI